MLYKYKFLIYLLLYTFLLLVYTQLLVFLVQDGVSEICYHSLSKGISNSVLTYDREIIEDLQIKEVVSKRNNHKKITKENLYLRSFVRKTSIFSKVKVRNMVKRESVYIKAMFQELFLLNQVSSDGEVEMDETISIFFSEKERKDGFKITKPEQNPYAVIVLIVLHKGGSLCSGSLVSKSHVLTAAHCFKSHVLTAAHCFKSHVLTAAHCFKTSPEKVIVYAGGNSLNEIKQSRVPSTGQIIESYSFFTHPKYNPENPFEYDVAVVHLPKPFRLTKYVKTIEMMSRAWTKGEYKACMITGFGVLQKGEKDALDHTRKTHYLEVKRPCVCLEGLFDDLIACSKPKEDFGVCEGDSGGGLTCDGRVVAVTTGLFNVDNFSTCGPVSPKDNLCAKNTTIHVFTLINPYFIWINSTLNSCGSFSVSSFLLIAASANVFLSSL